MTETENEFSHIIKLDTIGEGAMRHHLVASQSQCTALAKRFDLIALNRVQADIALSRSGTNYRATGTFQADGIQACVATGDPVPAQLNEPLDVIFSKEPERETDVEIELGAEDCDMMFHDGKGIDLGEAVAQSLALSLDPYPRSSDAEQKLRMAGVKREDEAGPFGILASLKDKLANT